MHMIVHKHQLVLNFDEIWGFCVILKVWQLLINFGLNKLRERFVLFDTYKCKTIVFQGVRDSNWVFYSGRWKFTQVVDTSMEDNCLSLFWIFELLKFIRFFDKLLYGRWGYKEVHSIRVGSLKLNGAWWSVSIESCPLFSHCSISLENGSIQLNKCLFNDRDVFSLPSLDIHHGR